MAIGKDQDKTTDVIMAQAEHISKDEFKKMKFDHS